MKIIFIFKKGLARAIALGAVMGISACSAASDEGGETGAATEGADTGAEGSAPDTYAFESRFEDGSSVAYSGQILRHVLIKGLAQHLDGLTARIDNGDFIPEAGQVVEELDFYFRFDGDAGGQVAHGIATTPAALQTAYADISSGKDLVGKIAGNDEKGQHKDWSQDLIGHGQSEPVSPQALIDLWFAEIETNALARLGGTPVLSPSGTPVASVAVTADGRDLRQLAEKFLLGAVAFSQGADDYLDDDVEGSGLLSDNTEADEGKPYTALEHAWDEAFGYFGAARDYTDYTDDEIAGKGGRDDFAAGYHDSDGDDAIDLTAEFNFGHAVNAAKRDRGSVVATDFSEDAIRAFLRGRHIIASAEGALSEDELAALQEARDEAVTAWERAIAATAVHYINEVVVDTGKIGGEDYAFEDHAKNWSELKGFALSLQFNPRSPLTPAQLEELHAHIGDAPVLDADGADDYVAKLLAARDLLGQAYGFAAENLGDGNGASGW